MLVEDFLHGRYDEHPEDATEGDGKDGTGGCKPDLVVVDMGCVKVKVLLVRLPAFVMTTMIEVTMTIVIMVAFFVIVAMVCM